MNRGSFSKPGANQSRRGGRLREQRRARFLSAAAQVFAQKGFHDASVEEIARKAECAAGTVYLYFENKEALYTALMAEKMSELAEVVERRAGRTVEAWEAIQNAIHAQFEFYEQNRPFFQSFIRERPNLNARLNHDKWHLVMVAYEQFIQVMVKLVKAAQRQGKLRKGDSRQFAVALCGMINQLTRDWTRRKPDEPLTHQAGFVAGLFQLGAAQSN